MTSEHGTFVVTMPSSDGLIICADKRVTNEEEIVSENEIKIHQLGPKAVFTATGLRRTHSANPRVPDFDLLRCIKETTADINLNYFLKYRDRVADELAAKFESTLRTQAQLKLEPRRVGCQALVWHLDSMNKLHGTRIDLDYDEFRSAQARKRVIDLDHEVLSGPNLAGDCDPFTALMDSGRTDLQIFREDQAFREFEQLSRSEQWQALSPARAVELGSYLISTCSRVQSLDSAHVPSIGPNSDCALLSLSRRFVWLKLASE